MLELVALAVLHLLLYDLRLNLLEVRGIGLLDIKAIFGETAVRRKMRLKLIVHLVRKDYC